MRVLITGGTGFIGGAVARCLLARGDSVVILARSAARADALRALGGEVNIGDVRDADSILQAARGCDMVIHAAGLPRPASWRTFRAVHIGGTGNVVAAARQAGVRRVVNVASQAVVFAGKDLLDVDESCPYPARFIDPYSATKAQAERLALGANSEGGLEVISVRPAVVWGRGDTTILPILAKLARSATGVPMCGDGANLETTTHIDNLTDGILAAMESAAAPGRAYFISDGFRVAWREFIVRQLEAAGVRPRFFRVPYILAGPGAWMLDHAAGALQLPVPLARFGVRTAMTSRRLNGTRARDELGYEPGVGWEDGLADLGAWVREMGGAKSLLRKR